MEINFDIQPDIICIQEGKVHYDWKQQSKLTINPQNLPKPQVISNYFCDIGSELFL